MYLLPEPTDAKQKGKSRRTKKGKPSLWQLKQTFYVCNINGGVIGLSQLSMTSRRTQTQSPMPARDGAIPLEQFDIVSIKLIRRNKARANTPSR